MCELVLLLTLASVEAVNCSAPVNTGAAPSSRSSSVCTSFQTLTQTDHFVTLAPGSALPSGKQCEQRVRPAEEVVDENRPYNQTAGKPVVGKTYLSSNIDAADLEERIDGQYTGTTDEIIQWGACKWGFDENLVRAQAYVESTWFAGKLGDCGETAQGETGGEGGCGSVDIMQVRSANLDPVFPGV